MRKGEVVETPTFKHQRLHGRVFGYGDLARAMIDATRGNSAPTKILAASPLLKTIQGFFDARGLPESAGFLGAAVGWADIPKDEVWLVNEHYPEMDAMNLILHVDESAIHDQFLRQCCD